jgi:hypothetical protein
MFVRMNVRSARTIPGIFQVVSPRAAERFDWAIAHIYRQYHQRFLRPGNRRHSLGTYALIARRPLNLAKPFFRDRAESAASRF